MLQPKGTPHPLGIHLSPSSFVSDETQQEPMAVKRAIDSPTTHLSTPTSSEDSRPWWHRRAPSLFPLFSSIPIFALLTLSQTFNSTSSPPLCLLTGSVPN